MNKLKNDNNNNELVKLLDDLYFKHNKLYSDYINFKEKNEELEYTEDFYKAFKLLDEKIESTGKSLKEWEPYKNYLDFPCPSLILIIKIIRINFPKFDIITITGSYSKNSNN